MISKNLNYVPRLDVLRFIAAASVILYHTYVWAPKWDGKYVPDLTNLLFLRGSFGVSLFMVMSGYLMAQIFIKYPLATYGEFIFNRVVRIVPLCLLVLIAGIAARDGNELVSQDVLNFILLQVNVDRAHLIAPIWTIAVEFQFYLLMPILAVIIARSGLTSLFKLMVFIIVFRMMVMPSVIMKADFPYNSMYYSILGRFDQFAVGIFIAHLAPKFSHQFKNPLHVANALVLFVALFFFASLNQWFDRNAYQVFVQSNYLALEGAICGYFMLAFLNMSINLPGEKLLAQLGAASYSMYLLHEVIVRTYLGLFPQSLIGLKTDALIIVLPTVTFFSLLGYHFFEKPFLAFRKDYTKQKVSG